MSLLPSDPSGRERSEIPLARLIRVGEVTSTDAAGHTCRVTFDDDEGYTSADLPVLVPNTLKNKDHALPDIGEDVLCLFLPGGVERGFVLGSFYAGNVTPPASSGDVRRARFSDGTTITYDRAAHKLTADVRGAAEIKTTGAAKIDAGGAVTIESGASVTVNAASSITLKAPTIQLNGAISTASASGGAGTFAVSGSVAVSGDVTAEGVSLASHVHTGVDTGGGISGGPR